MARKRTPETDETEDDPVAIVDERTAAVQAAAEAHTEGPAPDSGALDGPDLTQFGSGAGLSGGTAAEQVKANEQLLAEATRHADDDGADASGGVLTEIDVARAKDGRHGDWSLGSSGEGDSQGSGGGTLGSQLASENLTEAQMSARIEELKTHNPYGSATEPKLSDYNTVYGDQIGGMAAPSLNPLAGDAEQDPLSFAADAAADKLGNAARGLATPDDEAENAPAFGQGMISEGGVDYVTRLDEPGHKLEVATVGEGADERTVIRETFTRETKNTYTKEEHVSTMEGDTGSFMRRVTVNTKTGVITTTEKITYDTGATQTTKTVDRGEGDTTVTTTTTPPPKDAGPAGDPGPDGEAAPIPEELQGDAELAALRALQHQGPEWGDGATDPSEIETDVVGGTGDVPDHTAIGQELFGNPGSAGAGPSGSGVPFNSGAHGVDGLIQGPDLEGTHTLGPEERATQTGTLEPMADSGDSESSTDEEDDGDASFLSLLPSTEIAGPVDDIPDHLAVVDDVDD